MITAFVLFTVEPGAVAPLAERLLDVPGITEVYSVAGPYDLIAIARACAGTRISPRSSPRTSRTSPASWRTETSIAFRAFSKRDLGTMWDIGE